jgi:hypothetical protein
MTVAETRQGALEANWGARRRGVLEAYLSDFSILWAMTVNWKKLLSESRASSEPPSKTAPNPILILQQPKQAEVDRGVGNPLGYW